MVFVPMVRSLKFQTKILLFITAVVGTVSKKAIVEHDNGLLPNGSKLVHVLSKDMGVGAAQVMTSEYIPVISPVFSSCAAINATSTRANVIVHLCWVESNITDVKEHLIAAAEIPTVRGERSIPI